MSPRYFISDQRMHDFTVGVTSEPQTAIANDKVCFFYCGTVGPSGIVKLYCKPRPITGRYVTVIYEHLEENYLELCEVQVWGYKVFPDGMYIVLVHTPFCVVWWLLHVAASPDIAWVSN